MADVKRTWIKDAFWETPTKELLNCISEHKEGFKDVRQVHKLKRGDPLFDECVKALTEKHIDVNDPTNNCLDVAIITAPEKRSKKTIEKLNTVAGRVLNK